MREKIWEVWQGQTLICSRRMGLTKHQALNKVDNELRRGTQMEARPARKTDWYSTPHPVMTAASLTLGDCAKCGHRHRIDTDIRGEKSDGKCWLCTCTKFKKVKTP